MSLPLRSLGLLVLLPACEPDPSSDPDGFAITSTQVTDNLQLVLEKRLQVELSATGQLTASCVLEDDDEEVHVLASEQSATSHELILRGICPECRYDCTLEALADNGGEATGSLDFEVGTLPFDIPAVGILELDESQAWGAYTLMSHRLSGATSHQYKLLLVDLHGRVRWYYLVHPLTEDTKPYFVGTLLDDGRVLFGGGDTFPPTLISQGAELLWQAGDPPSEGSYDHHVEMLDNGNVLALAKLRHGEGSWSYKGFEVVEIDPEDDTVVWQYDSNAALESGILEAPTDGSADPWHANALIRTEDELGEALWISLRDANELMRVDYATGEASLLFGRGNGYLLYNAAGERAGDTDWFAGQHAPTFADGRFLMYDNGHGNGQRQYSRALELEVDFDAKEARVVWEYLEDDWWERQGGDVDRLPNGNLLITMGNSYGSDTGVPEGNYTAVVEVVPSGSLGGEVVWRLQFQESADGVYRSQRIDGCAMFANARYCPELR